MSWTFNPPPDWPVPADGWFPPPGWTPDPAWPPAPPGWEFWVRAEQPTAQPSQPTAQPTGNQAVSGPLGPPAMPPLGPPAMPPLGPPVGPPVAPGGRAGRTPALVAVLVGVVLVATLAATGGLVLRSGLAEEQTGRPEGAPVPVRPTAIPRVTAAPAASADGQEIFQRSRGMVGAMAVVELDGAPAVVMADGTSLLVLDLAGTELRAMTGHRFVVTALAAGTAGGTPLAVSASTGADEPLRVWDLTTGEQLHELVGHDGAVQSVAVGELSGAPVAISTNIYDNTVRLWDLTTGEQLGEPFGQVESYDDGVALAITELDGGTVALVGRRGGVEVWRLAPAEEPVQDRVLALTRNPGAPWSVATGDLDGTAVAVAGDLAEVVVWELATGNELGRLAAGPGWVDAVRQVQLVERDQTLLAIVGHGDGTIRVWDVAGQEQVRAQYREHTGTITALAVAGPDRRSPVVVSGDVDGRLRVWPLA